MKSLGFFGKLLFVIPLAVFGLFHFMNASSMAGYVPGFLPIQEAWVYLTGLGFILSAVAILINKKAKLATILLGVMLLSFAVLVHMGGFFDGDPMQSANFLKAISLSGAAFFMSSKVNN
ncbi:MAG: DoxX family protein [Marinoscillum sp.]